MSHKEQTSLWKKLWHNIFFALGSNMEQYDFTRGSIRKAIYLLAVPMILELALESVFALVDVFFVSRLGSDAVSVVVLTESLITIVFSIAMGLSMAATALVARRVGEQNFEAASHGGAQAIVLGFFASLIIAILGVGFSEQLLKMMGATDQLAAYGKSYITIMLGGNLVIMLLFLINGIFRGAGNAAVAMRSLWVANACNIVLCPILIHGIGSWQGFGLVGAAIATTTGRGVGVIYQCVQLAKSKGRLRFRLSHFRPATKVLSTLTGVASTGMAQFLIASGSWIFMARLIAEHGVDATAGYGVAIRLIIFFILPAWGMSNAAATLVGQNLGANLPERAEQSVWQTARYNAIFMALVTICFYVIGPQLVRLLNSDDKILPVALQALRIISAGYILYGISMVMMNAFNGAGDTRTPTFINFIFFWLIQIPLAWLLSSKMAMGPKGVFIAVVAAESLIAFAAMWIFARGKWKLVKI